MIAGMEMYQVCRYPVPENLRFFVMIDLCDGYTTFSAFSLQTLDLQRSGTPARAVANMVASIVLCIGAVAVGHYIGAWFNGGATQIAQITLEEEA